MNECDGNQQLENMSATQTQKRINDFFFWQKFRQTSENQQSGETDGEKQSADGNAEKSYAKKFKLSGYKSLNFTGFITTMQKIW